MLVMFSAAMNARSVMPRWDRPVLAAMLVEADPCGVADPRRCDRRIRTRAVGSSSANARWQSHKAVILTDHLRQKYEHQLAERASDLVTHVCGSDGGKQ